MVRRVAHTHEIVGSTPTLATTRLAWGAVVSPEFRADVIALCGRIGIVEPSWLMACMAFETGCTFSPSRRNARTRATGLIQFMPKTAIWLGTTVEELACMTAVEQLEYVEAYFQPVKFRFATLSDVYMAILWPVAVGKPESHPLFKRGTNAYTQNRELDLNVDGVVTKEEATAFVKRRLVLGFEPGKVWQA